jgi:hypothetical protein
MANWQKALDRSLNWVDDNTRGNSIKSVVSQVSAATWCWVILLCTGRREYCHKDEHST